MGFHWAERVIITRVAPRVFVPTQLPEMGSNAPAADASASREWSL